MRCTAMKLIGTTGIATALLIGVSGAASAQLQNMNDTSCGAQMQNSALASQAQDCTSTTTTTTTTVSPTQVYPVLWQ
jgi:hypothetical protein